MNSKFFFIILGFSLLLGACSSNQPQIALEQESFDFGDVVNGEILTYDLAVSNQGDAPLVVETVSTSCGCTTATLEPMTIQPEQNAVLHIEYDSGAHGPELTGELVRMIFIMSNDPQTPEARIEFSANILPQPSP